MQPVTRYIGGAAIVALALGFGLGWTRPVPLWALLASAAVIALLGLGMTRHMAARNIHLTAYAVGLLLSDELRDGQRQQVTELITNAENVPMLEWRVYDEIERRAGLLGRSGAIHKLAMGMIRNLRSEQGSSD
jgi:hypothetical protein